MRPSEWITVGFLAYLVVVAWWRPVGSVRRALVAAISLPLIALVLVVARQPSSLLLAHVRDWLPLPCMLSFYWQTAWFFSAPQPLVEERFVRCDRLVRQRLGAEHLVERAPRVVLEWLEAAYFSCYAVLPAGLVVLLVTGHRQHVDWYWRVVLLAELSCYAMLPWVRTRTPWELRPNDALDRRGLFMRRVNLLVVRHGSTRLNTFPSGHAAGALAAALALLAVSPVAGVVFLALAGAIAVASVVGDYHYAGDVITGAGVALASWLLVVLTGV